MLGSISCLSVPQCAQQLKRSAWLAPAPQRLNSSLPLNIGVLFVLQQEAWVVERMGKFHRILEPVRRWFSALLGAGRCLWRRPGAWFAWGFSQSTWDYSDRLPSF